MAAKRVLIGSGIIFTSALVWGGITFYLASRSAPPFPFLANAKVVKNEEWIEHSSYGPGRLKIGGEYRLPGSLEDIALVARSGLPSAVWKEEIRGKGSVTYASKDQYVTLLDRPAAGEVKVIIQSYRKPTFIDKARLWMRKQGWVK